ncbi:MAG: aminotransferase class V-fold PLP-dependent enzyme [Deltaproteobacteria bacterium]|nr:aminotransferase class V-fold PLP-dependent enzyme [Deltaproteobacteria bacterium]
MPARRNLIYMDHAATSFPRPREVIDAVAEGLREFSANPGRSGHFLSLEASRAVFEARETVAHFFKISDSRQVIFTKNVTEALNLAIYGILEQGDHVVTTSMEHNSVMRPLRDLEARGIIQLTVVPSSREGAADISGLAKAIRLEQTKLLVVNHASNVVGTVVDLKAISEIKGPAYLLVDAAQSAGCMPIDLSRLDVDLFAFTGHKALRGPQGTGGLILKTGKEPVKPLMRGGTGSHSEFEAQPEFLPDRLESGTPNVPNFMGLAAGIRVLEAAGVDQIRAHEKEMTGRLLEGLLRMDRVRVYGPKDPERQTAVVSINVDGMSPSEVGFQLDRNFDICVRTGLHCAPSAHRTIGSFPRGSVRISMGMTTTVNEVEEVLGALKWLVSH